MFFSWAGFKYLKKAIMGHSCLPALCCGTSVYTAQNYKAHFARCCFTSTVNHSLVISQLWTSSSTDSVALGTLLQLSGKKLGCTCWKIHVTREVKLELREDIGHNCVYFQ